MEKNNSWRKAYYVLLAIVLVLLIQVKGGQWSWAFNALDRTWNIRWIYVLLLSFLLARLLTPAAIWLGWRFGILDHPAARKIHTKAIPRIGGLAIFLAVMTATARNAQFSTQLLGLLTAGAVIYVIGFFDDIRPLSATLRLLAQVLACLIAIKSGVVLTVIPCSAPFVCLLNPLITVIWLLGMANAVNFLDGVDGLVAGMVAISALLFFFIAWPTRQSYLAYLLVAMAGACLGFLPYNWKPARTFMGDAGATFLGFMIAGAAVMGSWATKNFMVAVSVPLIILAIPIFDMIYTTVSRFRNGQVTTLKQWLEYTGKDHFHHRLMNLGFNQKQTVLFIWTLCVSMGLGAIVIRDAGTTHSVLVLMQSVLILLIIITLMLVGREKT
jgi:UDP-GlcNAc:undecaprenyl-phosphate/decaprenyl-phosphate GlcNAc-1-phosphate transferase